MKDGAVSHAKPSTLPNPDQPDTIRPSHFSPAPMLLLERLLLMISAVALGWLARHFRFPYREAQP